MLTKVYALLSEDGLPIYDTRVAAATAGLVEIYRVNTHQDWRHVPDLLSFPVPEDGSQRRRHLLRLNKDALRPVPHTLRYLDHDVSARWASAKIRLGWIINAVLKANTELLIHQRHSRQHAFEAALFMIGYDIQCLSPNLN